MEESLFSELKRIGIDEELAAKVSASLDPDYNASKKDVLVMQEAILQVQNRADQKLADFQAKCDERNRLFDQKLADQQAKSDEKNRLLDQKLADQQAKSDERHNQFIQQMANLQARTDERYYELKTEIGAVRSDLLAEIHTSINRQYLLTFGGMVVTITAMVAVNWYFHL